jgi:hypothetical protein
MRRFIYFHYIPYSELWELDWLNELFDHPIHLYYKDINQWENNDCIVTCEPEKVLGLLPTQFKFYLVHLSDEFVYQEINEQVYQRFTFVYRNHFKLNIPSHCLCFPLGYKKGFIKNKQKSLLLDRKYIWSFVGSIRNERKQMIEEMKKVSDSYFIHSTSGFNTQDCLPTNEYFDILYQSFFIPCGIGNSSVDTFRVYEALECGCIPIVLKNSIYQPYSYWEKIFPNETLPFIIIEEWFQIKDAIQPFLENIKIKQKQVYYWYKVYKSKLKQKIQQSLN